MKEATGKKIGNSIIEFNGKTHKIVITIMKSLFPFKVINFGFVKLATLLIKSLLDHER